MVRTTERQQAANGIIEAYTVHLLVEALAPAESDSDSSSSSSSDSDDDGDTTVSGMLLQAALNLYSSRYLVERRVIPKSGQQMALLLGVWKMQHPDIFRTFVRISPACFDTLLDTIQGDPIFHNNSINEQMPVAEQLAIALIRFGHFGNAAAVRKLALWAGVGFGTVEFVTNRIIIAVCREQFRAACISWPTEGEQERARLWVEENSCPAWRGGWCMVDGTLIPLFMRPGFFGNTFFDRKSNYSLNVQVSNCSMVHYKFY